MASAAALRAKEREGDMALTLRLSGLSCPARLDTIGFVAGDPDHDDLRARGTGLVANPVRRPDESGHPGLEDLALAVDDVLELSREDVERLDRAVRVLARVE